MQEKPSNTILNCNEIPKFAANVSQFFYDSEEKVIIICAFKWLYLKQIFATANTSTYPAIYMLKYMHNNIWKLEKKDDF